MNPPAGFLELGIRLPERPGEHRCPCPAMCRGQAPPARRRARGQARARRRRDLALPPLRLEGRPPAGGSERRHGVVDRATAGTPARPRPAAGLPEVAARLWAARRPIAPGTVAGSLPPGRGCALPPPDGDLALAPGPAHPSGYVGPALLALVTDAVTGEPMTLHRTWLAADGSGKAPVDKPRLLLKGRRKKGGVVRLWPDEEVTTGLCVAEGVETALTAARGFGLAWACLDAGNLAGLPVLPGVEALTIVADHDEAGLRAADACGRRWLEAGREVRVWKAPAEGADLNDYAREAAA